MSQQEILKVMKKFKGDWVTIAQIVDMMNISKANVSHALTKLHRWNEVEKRQVFRKETIYDMSRDLGTPILQYKLKR